MSLQHIKTYLSELQATVAQLPANKIDEVVTMLLDCAARGSKVFICGNGGSASTASHFACDLGKNTQVPGAAPFKVIPLTDNMEMITAWANDTDYSNVFAAQLNPLVEMNDVVIGISCSGNSPNVVNALKLARERGAKTIGFTGDVGGQLPNLVDICIKVASPRIEQQEDVHLIVEHCVCATITDQLKRKFTVA